jgi:GPH family glycoside/pentoside/hexuronide:cation symporter
MFVSAAVLPLCRVLGEGDTARGWQRCFMLLGGLAALGFLATFFGTRERVQPPRHQRSDVRRDLRDMFSNGPWLILVAFTFLFNVTLSVRSSVAVHYVKYYVGAQPLALPAFWPEDGGTRTFSVEELVSILNTSGGLSCLGGVLLAPVLLRLLRRKPLLSRARWSSMRATRWSSSPVARGCSSARPIRWGSGCSAGYRMPAW